MANGEKNLEVIKKYYFRKNGVLETNGYDWIGDAEFNIYPVKLDGKFGFADNNGEIVVPIIYEKCWNINSKYIALKKDNLLGLIKHDGTIVVEFCWEDMKLEKLNEALLPVKINEKWGFVNVKTGKVQVKPIYSEVEFFWNGFAPVSINEKWGMIDKDGKLIIQPKYLLDFYFEGDFTLVFEGGSWEYGYSACSKAISNSNVKIISKNGNEIVTDCTWIDRTGIDVFDIQRTVNGKKVRSIKQLISFSNYIIVIDNGNYKKGYVTAKGKYLGDCKYEKGSNKSAKYYTNAKYIGGGSWSAIDYNGNAISISDKKLEEIKKSLLAN